MSVNEYKGVYVFAQQVDNHIESFKQLHYLNTLVSNERVGIKFILNRTTQVGCSVAKPGNVLQIVVKVLLVSFEIILDSTLVSENAFIKIIE